MSEPVQVYTACQFVQSYVVSFSIRIYKNRQKTNEKVAFAQLFVGFVCDLAKYVIKYKRYRFTGL